MLLHRGSRIGRVIRGDIDYSVIFSGTSCPCRIILLPILDISFALPPVLPLEELELWLGSGVLLTVLFRLDFGGGSRTNPDLFSL